MFRRREENEPMNEETNEPTSTSTSTYIPASAQAGQAPLRPVSVEAPKAPAAPVSTYRPAAASASQRTPETRQAATPVNDKAKSGSKRVLTVGNDILLKGEIATCDRLVIEGSVDATLKDVHTLELAETGSFKGTAEVEDAEISGLFEGDIVVRNRLVIYSTGKVRGKITYGEIEIERGGELTGEIKTIGSAAAASKPKIAA